MNIPELKAAAIRAGLSNRDLARETGLSNQAFYNKLNGQTEFKNSEIVRLSKLLSLSMADVNNIFFDGIVN